MPDMPTVAPITPATSTALLPPPLRLATAADLDRLWHSWHSRFTGGRSTSAASLAVLDWAAHAANAPFQMAGIQRAGFAQWHRLARITFGQEPAVR
jgi:polyhydroxyalkanoate synthase